MRFAALHLERYGRFEDCRLSFQNSSPDFHIIYGPNEAGKSTTLAAVSDMLFGIPLRSPYNFRFDYALMRIGAVLEEDERQLACRRRKSRDRSLVDANDAPLDEGQLQALLHGLNRETFTSGFSLNQAELRRGGNAMMEASGDLGQTLFAAGSGLTHVVAVQTALDSEAEAIWGRRAAARRTFTQAQRQLEESLTALRERELRPKEWSDARAAVEACQQALANFQEQQRYLTQERIVAERLRRISPHMQVRAIMLANLAEQGPVVQFSRLEEDNAEAALAALDRTYRDRTAAAIRRDDVAERLQALHIDPIVEFAERIESLVETRGAINKAALDLTRLQTERQGMEEKAAKLRTDLTLEGEIPSLLTIRRLRDIASRHVSATTNLQTRTDALADLRARSAPLRKALADATLAEGLHALKAAIAEARGLGENFDERCVAGRIAADRAEAIALAALQALSPWNGNIDGLTTLYTLDSSEIQTASEAEIEARAALNERIADRRRLVVEKERLDAERANLTATGHAISLDAVQLARTARDRIWQEIDTHLCGDTPVKPPIPLTTAYVDAVTTADTIADRRYDTAEASARLSALDHDRSLLALRIQQSEQSVEEVQAATEVQQQAWRERLQAHGLPPLLPAQLPGWYVHREKALEHHQAAIEARRQASHAESRKAEVLAALSQSLTAPPETDRLSLMLAVAERERMAGELLERDFLEKRATLTTLDEQITSLERQVEQDERTVESAATEWAAEQTKLAVSVTIRDIEGWLELIETLRDTLEMIADHNRRIQGISNDRDHFEVAVTALAEEVGLEQSADPSKTLDVLKTRLSDARLVAQESIILTLEQGKHQTEVNRANFDHEASLTALEPLLGRVGGGAPDALRPFLEKSKIHRESLARKSEAELQIVTEGDNLALNELIAAWEACDLETLATRAIELEQQLSALSREITAAADALGEARKTFAALDQSPHAAADAASDAEMARADMKDQAEIYVLKRTQSLVLRWAVDRYRERRQAPLLARASTIFSTLTLGRFTALRIDYDSTPPRLLGLRNDQETLVPIDGMSEGTADQLFLALRLAAVEQSIAAGVKAPFLADDLFVNFDDDRAEAGFRVLSELAQSTQVLFFTHHAHLRNIVQNMNRGNSVSECNLI